MKQSGIIVFFLLLFFLVCFGRSLWAEEKDIPSVVVRPAKKSAAMSGGPKKIVTHQQFVTSGASNLSQGLQYLGGVTLHDTTGNGSQTSLSLRGFGGNASSNTLLLINGIPIANPDLAAPNLNIIPVQEIKYIEILAGTESVLYGDQAVGGVINIETGLSTYNDISCSLGSYKARNCYLSLNNHYRNVDYQFFAKAERTDNYRDHNAYHQNLLNGQLNWQNDVSRLRFDYHIGHENMQYPGALTGAQVRENRRQSINHSDFFKDWNDFLHLQYQAPVHPDWQGIIDLSTRDMRGNGFLMSPFDQSRTTYFIRPHLKGVYLNTHMTLGAELQHDQYDLESIFGETKNQQQKYSLFGLLDAPLQEKLHLMMGARGAFQHGDLTAQRSDRINNRAFASTLGLTYQIDSASHVYVRRATSYRFPKADENTFTDNGIGSLKTQRGVSYESGVEWRHHDYGINFDIYQLNLRDEIAFDPTPTPQQPWGSNRNLSPTKRRGFSLSGNYHATDQLTFGGQYNFVNARFASGLNEDKRIPLVSERILLANFAYQLHEHWQLYLEALFTGSQFPANDDANQSRKIGGYMLINANLRFEYKKFLATLRLNNLLNKAYYYYSIYQMNQVFYYPAPDRNVLLTITYHLT